MANSRGELTPVQQPGAGGLWWRRRRIMGVVVRFLLGQGAMQGINILTGLYLVRVLSIESYAQFGLAQGFQQTVGMLMDLGLAATIIPLVGDQAGNRALVGKYVHAAKNLRDRAFWVLAPIAVIVFLAIMRHHHWSWYVQSVLIASVLLAIYSSGKVSYYAAPLFLYGKLKEYYLPQTLVGGGRLLLVLGMRVIGALNGWTAALTSALNITLNGEAMQRECRKHIEWPEANDPKINREMLKYVLPVIPAMVFAAYQGQSSVFLISIFGQTAGIAQVSALGRLGQLFGILSVFNVVVVEPSMAKLSKDKVPGRYALLVGLGMLLCAPVVILAFVEPGPVLWVLGSKYGALRAVVGWAMLTGSLNYLSMLMWIMNRSRKWIYWSGTVVEIVFTIAVQVAYLLWHGLHTTSDAVFFGLATSFGPLVTHFYVMVVGMISERRLRRRSEAVSTV